MAVGDRGMKYLPPVRVKSSPSLLRENKDYDDAVEEEGKCEPRHSLREETGCRSL